MSATLIIFFPRLYSIPDFYIVARSRPLARHSIHGSPHMHAGPFPKNTLSIICFLTVALAVQAQTTPVFTPGSQVTQVAPSFKVLAADVNNDGVVDLISMEINSTVSSVEVYLGNGDGTFRTPFSVLDAQGIADIAVGDFNQDGNLDLAILVSSGPFDATGKAAVTVLLGNGQGSFGSAQTIQAGSLASGLAAGDFNNDGRTDLAVLATFAKTVTILTNTGTGFTVRSFTVPTHFDTANPGFRPDLLTSIVAGDFNGDGKMDLLYQDACGDSGCAVSQEAYFLLTNTGSGFTAKQLAMQSTGATALHTADLDGDGKSDFYFAFNGCHTPCSGVTVGYSNGDGTFQALEAFNGDTTVGGNPSDVIAGDFNNDGVMDIAAAVSAGFSSNPGLDFYLGKGGRSGFANPVHFDSPNGVDASPFRIAAGFINHDGQKDIFLVENGDFIPYLNNTGTAQAPCAAPANPGLNFCVPVDNGVGRSPFHFVGSFYAQTQPANRIELWIDGQKKFQVFNDIIDVSLPVSIGSHTATLVGVGTAGAVVKVTHSIFVQAECPVPTTGGTVSICTPRPGDTVTSPVHIAASAAPPAGKTISAMRIYIDNVAKLTVSGNTITDDIAVPAGNHLLAVVAYFTTGGSDTASQPFTVSGSTAGPCLPSGPGIKVCTPASGATVTSPVEVSAGASPTAQKITAIRVYVDNVAVFLSSNNTTSSSFSIDQQLTMAPGTRHLVVVAYQNNGTALTASETITVQ